MITKTPRRGRTSELPLITLNKIYGRIYFSQNLVSLLPVSESKIAFEYLNGSWYLHKQPDAAARKVVEHNGSFYLVHNALVSNMLDSFNCNTSIELLAEPIDENFESLCLSFYRERRDTVRRANHRRPRPLLTKPRMNNPGEFVKDLHETAFPGRIKTQEALIAEKKVKSLIARLTGS